MREAHYEAARQLYKERNQDSSSSNNIIVDILGLHPEGVEYLEHVLIRQQKSSRPVYAIISTGHHSTLGR